MREQDGRCYYCGLLVWWDGDNKRTSAINEHRVPLSRGGPHRPSNIVVACGRCDSLKGDLTDVEFLSGVRCAGGFKEYEKFHKWALLLSQIERDKRADLRRKRFFNPEQLEETLK